MEQILKAIKSVFNDFDKSQFSKDLEMGDIPGWDSMNSVNLQLEIESIFNIKPEGFLLGSTHTVGDIIKFLKVKGVNIEE